MLTIDDYIDRAVSAQKFSSERALSKALGMAPQSVSQWRVKRAWPADDAMVKLAELGNMDPEQALLDLNRWRCKSIMASEIYARLAKRISGAAAAIMLAVIVFSGDAKAAPAPAPQSFHNGSDLYIMRSLRRWWRRRFRRWMPHAYQFTIA